jgi:hypothetical protein
MTREEARHAYFPLLNPEQQNTMSDKTSFTRDQWALSR